VFGQDRNQMRNFFIKAWGKANDLGIGSLEPLEKLVVQVIEQHPEYHVILKDQNSALDLEFLPETGQSNPFLHMGMHLAIQEQLDMHRPPGINTVWNDLCKRHSSSHEAEHQMMECLAETLWVAQRNNTAPDENAYLERLNLLL